MATVHQLKLCLPVSPSPRRASATDIDDPITEPGACLVVTKTGDCSPALSTGQGVPQ